MVVKDLQINNIIEGIKTSGGVRLHNHKRKLKQRFDIIKKLGQGTYGKVQLGINRETGEEVAIKTIKKCKIETESDLTRIRREIQIMSSVQHPNIIHIFEVFENKEKIVLVMEYAAGGELYDYLSTRQVLTETEARRLFRQIILAVFYCHKYRICHRDLKLENILLDQYANAKIADFGLSNVFDEQRLLSTFCGSPLYASPEIVKGTPYVGPEVDCWSLGVLLYTLVYGAMPFDGSNFKKLVQQIAHSDYFEPKSASTASPLIKDMLTVNRSKRANIEMICNHWWVNEGYELNCLFVAEDLVIKTPVQINLLLSIVPQSTSAEGLIFDVDKHFSLNQKANVMSLNHHPMSRSYSAGNIIKLEKSGIRKIRKNPDKKVLKGATTTNIERKFGASLSLDETVTSRIDKNINLVDNSINNVGESRLNFSISPEAKEIFKVDRIPHVRDSDMEVKKEINPTSSKILNIPLKAAAITITNSHSIKDDEILDLPIPEKNLASKLLSENGHMKKEMNRSLNEYHKNFDIERAEKSKVTTQKEKILEPEKQFCRKKAFKKLETDILKTNQFKSNISEKNTQVTQKNDIFGKSTSDKESPTKKSKKKALSLETELLSQQFSVKPNTQHIRSKVSETTQKLVQQSKAETDKPKKFFISGIDVGEAKLAFEKRINFSANAVSESLRSSNIKIAQNANFVKENVKIKASEVNHKEHEKNGLNEEKKRAVDIISEALTKPPAQKQSITFSPLLSYHDKNNQNKLTKISDRPKYSLNVESGESMNNIPDEKKCSKFEIVLKSATLPRSRKMSKAKIKLISASESNKDDFRSEKRDDTNKVNECITADHVLHCNSSSDSINRNSSHLNEHIIPIKIENNCQQASTTLMTESIEPCVTSESTQISCKSVLDSDLSLRLNHAMGSKLIKKSPREFIIPIVLEGENYDDTRVSKAVSINRLLHDDGNGLSKFRSSTSENDSYFLSRTDEEKLSQSFSLPRGSLLPKRMNQIKSSWLSRQAEEHSDSFSSGEDDDDGFELLTAENLFSTLLSRVKCLTKQLNSCGSKFDSLPNCSLLQDRSSNTSGRYRK